MGRLTTHVLDTAAGKPAAGLRVVFRAVDGGPSVEALTNADGRLDRPLLDGPSFKPGQY
jgi:5-hydroxyisourate hydrolase